MTTDRGPFELKKPGERIPRRLECCRCGWWICDNEPRLQTEKGEAHINCIT
jgi:hypothetical protein